MYLLSQVCYLFRPAPVLCLIILMVSGEALHYAVLSNLLSFFVLLSEHFPQHSVLKRPKTIFFTFMWPCIVTNFCLIKPTDALIFPNLFLSRKSTCFGQFLCPSSGVLHCTFGTGVCHAVLMTYTNAEFTVENSWWWAEELPETCRVCWQK